MILILLIANILLQPEYYTNTNYFYQIIGADEIIFSATNGGVVSYNYFSGSFNVLTNVDGLQMNSQRSIGLDSLGYLWVGSSRGLAVIDPTFSSIQQYPSQNLASTDIQEIVCMRDSIYVGSTGGLSFIDSRGTPADTSDDLIINLYDTDGLPSDNVLSIAVGDTLIWVGTSDGLVHFRKDLTSPVQYDTSDGLLGKRINKVFIRDTLVYVGTDRGLHIFQDGYFDTLLIDYEIIDISFLGDSLALALDTISQFGFYYQGTFSGANNGIPYRCRVLSLLNFNDNLFCGLGNRFSIDYFGEGVGRYDTDDTMWEITKNQCLPSNRISEITANEHGIFVACGARARYSRGFGWLNDDGDWTNFTRDSIIPSNHVHRCVTAPGGKIWFCLNAFPDDTASVMAFSYYPHNGSDEWFFLKNRYNGMEGSNGIWDIEFDSDNNMFLALSGPSDKLWVIDSALSSVYFLGVRMPEFNVEIAIDSADNIWRTLAKFGLIVFDRGDDSQHNFSESDGLISDNTRGCAVDRNDNLYVATDKGLAIYDGAGFSVVTDISLYDDLLDVEIDSEGRIWIMARSGIYYYDPQLSITDGFSYNELNIHIDFIDDPDEIIQVQGFTFDPIRRCFWLGGQTGLLKLGVQYDIPVESEDVFIYPNPVVGKDVVRIKNIPLDSRVDIYSISGRRIAEELEPDEVFGEVVWQIPDRVGSGLYFALVKSDRGNRVCKFAIVR